MSRAETFTYGLPSRGSAAIAAASILTAGVAGVALASDVPTGVALVCAALYLSVIVLDLPLGIALWIPLIFFEGLPTFNAAGKAAGLVLIVGWIGALRAGNVATDVFSHHRRLLRALLLFAVWISLTLVWAPDVLLARSDLWRWLAVFIIFVVVATSLTTRRAITLACSAFVAAAAASVALSYLLGGGAANVDARLEYATASPNALAAGLVPAIALAVGLTALARGVLIRSLLVVTLAVLVFGLAASQSRGSLVAVCASGLTALAILKHRRRQVVAFMLMAVGVAMVSFMLDPSSWQRIDANPGRGTGRLDLWTVGWAVARDHPLGGVGLDNFTVVAPDYVRDVGPLQRVDLVADKPHAVHNLYLQLVAETGVVGLVCFLAFVGACLYASWRAARLYRNRGSNDLEALAHAILIGTVGMLATFVFSSNVLDRRLWVLFALGPAVLTVARRGGAHPVLAAHARGEGWNSVRRVSEHRSA